MNYDDGGFYYTPIKAEFKRLMVRDFLTIGKTEVSFSWIGDVEMSPGSSTVKITFNKHLVPFLFDLSRNYTQYKLEEVLLFNSKYTIRIYELLQSHNRKYKLDNKIPQEYSVEVSVLRDMLEVKDIYPEWKEFRRRVIQTAVDEINKKSEEMHVEYKLIKEKKKVVEIVFIISLPKITQAVDARQERRNKLK